MEQTHAMRPMYVVLPKTLDDHVIHEYLVERDRALALEAVLHHAPLVGIDEALQQFGDSLLPTEHKLLRKITPEEYRALKSIKSKVGNLFGRDINIHVYRK